MIIIWFNFFRKKPVYAQLTDVFGEITETRVFPKPTRNVWCVGQNSYKGILFSEYGSAMISPSWKKKPPAGILLD